MTSSAEEEAHREETSHCFSFKMNFAILLLQALENLMACVGNTSWQGNLREPWGNEPWGVQEFPMDVIWSFTLPQLHLEGGWWQEFKALLKVENMKCIREVGEKALTGIGGKILPWQMLGDKKKCLLLASVLTC